MDSLIWRGYKQPLENTDLWDLSYENASSTIVADWNKHWKKTSAMAYRWENKAFTEISFRVTQYSGSDTSRLSQAASGIVVAKHN